MTALVLFEVGQEIAFWVCATLAVLGALGLVFSPKAVYGALSLAVTMLSLAALYATLDAPFLFAVQIIVYTGAILMMFLFVLRMVGVDATDSFIETLKGQRVLALTGGVAIAALLIVGIAGGITQAPLSVAHANAQYGGNVEGVAGMLFHRYFFVFEFTAALLITAAVGAMVLAHHTRVFPKKGQRELSDDRMTAYAAHGEHPGTLPNSGVYATHNSIGAPALLPDGTVAEKSISQTLVLRGATIDPAEPAAITKDRFAAIESAQEEDE